MNNSYAIQEANNYIGAQRNHLNTETYAVLSRCVYLAEQAEQLRQTVEAVARLNEEKMKGE